MTTIPTDEQMALARKVFSDMPWSTEQLRAVVEDLCDRTIARRTGCTPAQARELRIHEPAATLRAMTSWSLAAAARLEAEQTTGRTATTGHDTTGGA